MLKGCFLILCELPGASPNVMFQTIEALMVIHNIVTEFADDPTTIRGFNGEEAADVRNLTGTADERFDLAMGGDDLYRAGLLRRKILMDRIVINE